VSMMEALRVMTYFKVSLSTCNWDSAFQNGGKHGRLTSPDGLLTLTVSRSPSDSRSLYNLRRDLRKGILSAANMRVL
ncbi:hypothetical protein ACK30U_07880, partial [Aeromonas caviae]